MDQSHRGTAGAIPHLSFTGIVGKICRGSVSQLGRQMVGSNRPKLRPDQTDTDGPMTQPAHATAGQHTMQRSIAGRLLFWFLVIALIPCAILTAITARIATRALENSVRNNLLQIAASKAGELESYAMERVRDGTALARGPSVIGAMEQLQKATEGSEDLTPAKRGEKLSWASLEYEPS